MTRINLEKTDKLLYDRLKILLSTAELWSDGRVIETKRLVDKVGKLEIHIYSKEHAPPHFHVKIPDDFEATFSIEDCELIDGALPNKQQKIIEYWYGQHKKRLIEIWNNTRPTDCPVGNIL